MSKRENISTSVIKRLPRYYRFLNGLNRDGVVRISSRELSIRMGLTASQIRQDLNCFGGFGQQGYGYNVEQLFKEIGHILGLQNLHKTILIGAGNMGRALASHIDFEHHGFHVVGVFDKKESMAGQMVHGMPVRLMSGLEDFCRNNHPEIAILCTPDEAAEQLVPVLLKLGVMGYWNFTHYDIVAKHPDTAVQNVHLEDNLMRLSYQVSALKNNDMKRANI